MPSKSVFKIYLHSELTRRRRRKGRKCQIAASCYNKLSSVSTMAKIHSVHINQTVYGSDFSENWFCFCLLESFQIQCPCSLFLEKFKFGWDKLTEHMLPLVNTKSPIVPMCQGKLSGTNETGRWLGGLRCMFSSKYTLGHWVGVLMRANVRLNEQQRSGHAGMPPPGLPGKTALAFHFTVGAWEKGSYAWGTSIL